MSDGGGARSPTIATSMIKLAPSPRDAPRSSRLSPKSCSSPKVLSSSPKALSPGGRRRNRVEALAHPLAVGPEMDKLADVKKASGGSPKAASSPKKSNNDNPATDSGAPSADGKENNNISSSPKKKETTPPTSPLVLPPNSSPNTTRSKKMMVVDPHSGKKYHLHADDHSLTDKELHVYHKRTASQNRITTTKGTTTTTATSASRHRRSVSDGSIFTQSTHQTYDTAAMSAGDTLETASALTEVSYYGRYKVHSGPFECVIPTSCRSLEQMALGDLMAWQQRQRQQQQQRKKEEEERDDADSIHRGRYKHLLLDQDGGSKKNKLGLKVDTTTTSSNVVNDDCNDVIGSPANALLSPISALGPLLVSPLKSFFDGNNNSSRFNVPEGSEVVEVKVRRVCLVVFPDEVKRCLEGKLSSGGRKVVGLLGMTFVQDVGDFQAHVSYVQRGSKAEKMGVRKGDVVSFAVALSNMTEEENSFLAEKLIKRLESVGMRTSYRELFDIFLSKTTNGRPIGMVFRRRRNRGGSPPNNNFSPTNNLIRITDEFEWSTHFLQGLSIKCREYEFEQKVPQCMENNNEEEDLLPMLDFLPRPNVDTLPKNGFNVADYFSGLLGNLGRSVGYNNCASDMQYMKCVESAFGTTSSETTTTSTTETSDSSTLNEKGKGSTSSAFLSNRILCSLVEQSMGLIFLRRVSQTSQGFGDTKTSISGSGFAVVRKPEGSWSAPCFLSILGSKDEFTDNNRESSASSSDSPSSDDVKMIVIRKKELVDNLIQGSAVKFGVRRDERANVLVRDAAIIGVEEGRFQLAKDFFLAVKVNDIQNQGAYSLADLHIEASDILTGTISPPEQSVDFYGALQSLELPYSMHSHPVVPEMLQRYSDNDWVEFLPSSDNTSPLSMRAKLRIISQGKSSDNKREIDIFARKFQYYLMDGVPVHRLFPNNAGTTEEKVLRLTIANPYSLISSSLDLTRRRRPGVSNVGIPSNFSTTFDNITKLSRTPPVALSSKLDDEEKKRFFSIETDLSPGPVMMLAKSKKDAMILLCGLKLLLEREKMIPGTV